MNISDAVTDVAVGSTGSSGTLGGARGRPSRRPVPSRLSLAARKTVRRYVTAAAEAGVDRAGGEGQLDDALLARVCEKVRPRRPDGHGAAWATLVANHEQLTTWLVDDKLTVVKTNELLCRKGIVVPDRTLHRYALEVLGIGRSARTTTVCVADGEPGGELQVDFGKMGPIPDADTGRNRICQALIFTAASRHCFVWLTFRQTTADVLAGFEAAWAFYGGIFAVVIPDNMATIVERADPTAPRLNQAFVEYAQARGFLVDPARVRTPTDKPRMERTVPFVRNSFFAGERFIDLADAQRRAETWCHGRAGLRTHGTIQCRPAELFALEEAPRLAPAPTSPYELPIYATAKVHRDHHIEVAKALYSVPGNLIGQRVDVRADRALVRVSLRGAVVKVHPRTGPGGRVTDAEDLPEDRSIYAMRDLDRLIAKAADAGAAIGTYAAAVLDHPLPWTKMRQVYKLLGLVERWGAARVETACGRALEVEAVDVGLIDRMLKRGTESAGGEAAGGGTVGAEPARPAAPARFARHREHFATPRPSGAPHEVLTTPTETDGGAA